MMPDNEKLIAEFHEMWDAFPGMARLISILLSVTASSEGEEQSLKGKSHSKKAAP